MKTPAISILLSLGLAAAASALPSAKVQITCNDEMIYNTRRFEVMAGEKITLTLKNTGKIPAKTMGHNLVILKPGTLIPEFASKANAAKGSAYIPLAPEDRKSIVAHTRFLGGGESDTILFKVNEPGTYPFICTSPGHFSVMQGVMIVKEKQN